MAGWNPTLDNVISVCIRLQEYPKDVTSQFNNSQSKPHVGELLDEKDEHGNDTKSIRTSSTEFDEKRETDFEFKSSFKIDCERNKSVLALKERIFEATGYSAESQKLLYIGRYSTASCPAFFPCEAQCNTESYSTDICFRSAVFTISAVFTSW
jgi:hypothetical protein